MRDRAREIQNVQLDIDALMTMIDVALDRSAGKDETFLRACAEVLYDKRRRLDELEGVTLYVSRGDTGDPLVSRDTVGEMPERLDHVTIALELGTPFKLPWSSRDVLLEELRRIEAAREVVQAFEAVGATRPVELADADKIVLFSLLEGLTRLDEMPAGLDELRRRLSDDLADAG